MLVDDTVSSVPIFVGVQTQPEVTACIMTTGEDVELPERAALGVGIVALLIQSHPADLVSIRERVE